MQLNVISCALGLCSWALLASACSPKTVRLAPSYQLVWSDEFDKDGLLNPEKWSYDVGDNCPDNCGWGNNEAQYYTEKLLKNARVENGKLLIEARREKINNKDYSSARVVTKNKGDWKYGKIDVRAQLPAGVGSWPAIWMLPTDWKYGGWPQSGEIDIMENVGFKPDSLFGSVHTEWYNHIQKTQVTKGVFDPTLSSQYHNYGIEWDEEKIDFLFDEKKYLTFRNQHTGSKAYPFDQAFYLVLNVAVGGNWGGEKGIDNKIFPQKMLVDYVKVFQKK